MRCVSNAFCTCSRDTKSVGIGLLGFSPRDSDFTRLSLLEGVVLVRLERLTLGVLARLLSRDGMLVSRTEDCAEDVSTLKIPVALRVRDQRWIVGVFFVWVKKVVN